MINDGECGDDGWFFYLFSNVCNKHSGLQSKKSTILKVFIYHLVPKYLVYGRVSLLTVPLTGYFTINDNNKLNSITMF